MKAKLPKTFYKKVPKETKVVAVPIKKSHFPNITRSIPEPFAPGTGFQKQEAAAYGGILSSLASLLSSRIFLFNFSLGFILMAISIVGYDLHRNTQLLRERQAVRDMIVQKVATWKKAVTQYKGYRDGYYQLAVLSYRLQNKNEAYEYIQIAMRIDPGFVKGREFMQMLGE